MKFVWAMTIAGDKAGLNRAKVALKYNIYVFLFSENRCLNRAKVALKLLKLQQSM